MRKIGAVVAVVLLLGVGVQAYLNTVEEHPVDQQAQQIACQQVGTCAEGEYEGFAKKRTPFQRTYTWQTSRGTVEVRCRWPYVLWGDPECKAEVEGVPKVVPPAGGHRPHETPRAAPDLR